MNSTTTHQERSISQILLEDSQDDSSFLSALQACYRIRGVGKDLPFEAIAAYWRDGAALSDAWLDELGRNICFEPSQISSDWWTSEKLKLIHKAFLTELEPSQWFTVAEKSIYLLSPILSPSDIRRWAGFNNESGNKRLKEGIWCATLVESLLPMTEALAEGHEGWQAVHAWLCEVDADPRLFRDMLESIPAEKWRKSDGYSGNLNAHLILLLQIRLRLRVENPDSSSWAEWLAPTALLLRIGESYPAGRNEHEALLRNHAKPILLAAGNSPDLISHVSGLINYHVVDGLMNKMGFAAIVAQRPEAYQALIDAFTDDMMRSIWPPHELINSAPDLLFYHVRRRYERIGSLSFHAFTTPEAVAWYKARLPELDNERTRNDCIEWLASRQSQADTLAMLEGYCDQDCYLPHRLLNNISDIDALQRFLACTNEILRISAVVRLKELTTPRDRYGEEQASEFDPELWNLFIELSKRHPDLFIEASIDYYVLEQRELDRWELLWNSTNSPGSRASIAGNLFNACRKDENNGDVDPLALAERLYRENPQPFHAFIEDEYEDSMDIYIMALSDRETPMWEMIPQMAARYLMQSTWLSGPIKKLAEAPVQQAIVRYPESYAALEDKAQIKLLPYFDERALIACGTTLAELFAKSNKYLYQPAVELIARSTLDALRESGLLDLSVKKARKLVLTGLGLNSAPEIAPLLHQLITDKAHDDFSRGLMLDNLEMRGESVAELDDWADLTVENLQAVAAKQKIPAAVSKLWNADLAECLHELGEQSGLYLLHLLRGGDGDRLPRRARQILELIPIGRRADFAFLGVNRWIAENGSDKLKALLPPLYTYGNESAANALVKACKTWKKTRKPKSSAAIRMLCRMPGSYGISQAHALWESNQFSDSIMHNANQALTEAADRQGLSFEEFIEQLVPDFGLEREGMVLDVGPYNYVVKIKPDLSLLVVGPNGKTYKSLPKAKAEEDHDKRSQAENRFKGLRKNLKPVLKQQSRRLSRAFMAGKRWDFALWRKLFIDHPLMAIIAQGVVWSAEDAEGHSLVRFRPSDTGDRLNLEDENVTLEGAVTIHIVHPAEVDGEERAAWCSHFEDYDVISPLEQWEVPIYEADEAELNSEQVTRQSEALLNRGTFGSLMDKWGYQKGPGEDGAMINGHTWLVSHKEWLVKCEHSGVSVFFDPDEEVSVEALVPHRYAPEEEYHKWKPVALKDLPIALRVTLLAQAEALKSAALA